MTSTFDIDAYRAFVQDLLKQAGLNRQYRQEFTDENGIKVFLAAITHPSFDEVHNYQELEFVGDGILKGCITQYILRRFPDLKQQSTKSTAEGIFSKARRHLEQTKTLAVIAEKLGFWSFVRANEEIMTKHRNKTLEDVYEAFVGAIVQIIDTRIMIGLGYKYAYKFMKNSFDTIEINFSKETLDDPSTLLNELYMARPDKIKGNKPPLKWGSPLYVETKLFLHKLTDFPDPSIYNIFYHIVDKAVYYYDYNKWINSNQLGIKDISVPDGSEFVEDGQIIWYAKVYGFIDNKGNLLTAVVDDNGIITSKIDNLTKDKGERLNILANPSKYNAHVIGQGMHFKNQEAKKIAAKNALYFLNKKYDYSTN